MKKNAPLRIGFAGTLYDMGQFNILLNALNLSGWEIGSRPVILCMTGKWFRLRGIDFPCNIEFKGWQKNSNDTTRLLSECDLNYLPIPFNEEWRDFATLSFPTKLSTYLTSGRPVFCSRSRLCVICEILCSDGYWYNLHFARSRADY